MANVTNKWPRWVFASIAKHLHAAATAADLPLIVELLDDRSVEFRAAKYKAEATIAGPHFRELSKGFYRVQVDIFVVLSSDKQTDANAYDHLDYAGAIAVALNNCITVKEYDVGNDDPAFVGVLTPRTQPNDQIPIDNLKPGESDQRIHTVLEARLLGYFSEE